MASAYFSSSPYEGLSYLLRLGNEAVEVKKGKNPNKSNEYVFQKLDKYQHQIFGKTSWKHTLQGLLHEHETSDGQTMRMSHFDEFLSRKTGGCGGFGTHGKKCQECFMRAKLDDRPSCCVELLRNVHEHAVEKMQNHPGGVVDKILFPNGYINDIRQFVDYVMQHFPRLLPYIAALRCDQEPCDPNQVVNDLLEAIHYERDQGEATYTFGLVKRLQV